MLSRDRSKWVAQVDGLDIVQVRIARSRMAGEPPEVIVAPRLARLRRLDFHHAKEAIEEGYHAVERVAHTLAVLTIMHRK